MATRKTVGKKTTKTEKKVKAEGGSVKAIAQLARIQKAMDKLLASEEALSKEIDKLADILGVQSAFAAGPVNPRLLSVVPVDLAAALDTVRKRR